MCLIPHPTWGGSRKELPSLKLTVRTWKWMVGRQSFPFGTRPIFRCELLVAGSVKIDPPQKKTRNNIFVPMTCTKVRYGKKDSFLSRKIHHWKMSWLGNWTFWLWTKARTCPVFDVLSWKQTAGNNCCGRALELYGCLAKSFEPKLGHFLKTSQFYLCRKGPFNKKNGVGTRMGKVGKWFWSFTPHEWHLCIRIFQIWERWRMEWQADFSISPSERNKNQAYGGFFFWKFARFN